MQLAQALQGMSLSPVQNDLQQPQGGGKYYQAARVRPIAALSKLAEAMMAKKGFDTALPAMAQQYGQAQQAFAPGGQMTPGTPQQAAPPAADPNAQSVQPALARPPGQSFAQTVQNSQPRVSPTNPLNPSGLPANVMLRLYQSDPAKYAAMLQGTPEWQNALRAANGDPNQAMAMMHAQAVKASTVEARPGGWVQGPDGQWKQLPQGGPGQHLALDPQGNVSSTTIPGYNQQAGALAGTEEAAKVANKPLEVDIGGGARKLVYPGAPGSGIGLPPAARPAPPSNAPQGVGQTPTNKYFSAPPSMGPLPGVPPAGSTQPQADWLKNAPKMNIPNTPGQSTDSYHQKILDKSADKHIELADKYGSESDLADQRIAFNKEALGVLQGSETGPLSDTLTHLSAKAQELGLKLPWLPDAKTIENTQELKKFLLRNPLLSLKTTFGGRPAASEFQVLANDASPSPQMLKSTIARLVQMDSTQAGYVKQRATDYGQYQQAGGDPTRFESYYANTHPFAKTLESASGKTTTPAKEDIEAEMRRRGLLK
jgi:hypothetical protein